MAIKATTSVLTSKDWKYAKDVQVGDWVFNRLGQPVQVKSTQTFRSEECYRVVFDDYMSLDGDKHLTFPTEDLFYRHRTQAYKGIQTRRANPTPRSIEQLLETGLTYRETHLAFSVPTTEPIQFPHQAQGIPAFVFGIWYIGQNGYKEIRVANEFAEETYQKFKDFGYQVEKRGTWKERYQKFRTVPSIWDQLRGETIRKIPLRYLNGSPEQRLELLRGMFSAKPCRKVSKQHWFVIKSRKKAQLAAIQYVAESLGAKTKLTIDNFLKLQNLKIHRIQSFMEQMAPIKPVAHLSRRYVKSIEPIPAQLCVHIETDEKDGTFLVGEGFISVC